MEKENNNGKYIWLGFRARLYLTILFFKISPNRRQEIKKGRFQ